MNNVTKGALKIKLQKEYIQVYPFSQVTSLVVVYVFHYFSQNMFKFLLENFQYPHCD